MRKKHGELTAEAPAGGSDIDMLLALGGHLSGITSLSALGDAIAGPLRPFLPSRDISVLRAAHGAWEAAVGPLDGAERIHQYRWTPLVDDGKTIGMLGIGAPAVGGAMGKAADAATALLVLTAQHLITIENLRQDSVRDTLTGCFTRAHALEVLEGNLRRANRTGFPVSILMIDVDDFKRINDGFGHVPGDAVLTGVATLLHGMLRQSDVRCRLGGDEFLVILPDTPFEHALRVAESVRHAIEELAIPTVRGRVRITASIGVATAVCGAPIDVPAFVDRADVALYGAKQNGRNGVHGSAGPARGQVSGVRVR